MQAKFNEMNEMMRHLLSCYRTNYEFHRFYFFSFFFFLRNIIYCINLLYSTLMTRFLLVGHAESRLLGFRLGCATLRLRFRHFFFEEWTFCPQFRLFRCKLALQNQFKFKSIRQITTNSINK